MNTSAARQVADVSNSEESISNPDMDAALMPQIAEGSDAAMRMIIEHWKQPIVNYFYRSVNNLHTAEDLAQQTFINIYRAAPSYSPKAKFSTYIFHIARHVLINEYRKVSRRPADATDPDEIIYAVDGRAELNLSELEEIFAKTLETLPENQRTAILLLKQQELSYEEIADAMKASVGAVKTWIHRARQTLRDALTVTRGNASK